MRVKALELPPQATHFGCEGGLLTGSKHALTCTPLILNIAGRYTYAKKRVGQLAQTGCFYAVTITQRCNELAVEYTNVRSNRHKSTSLP